MESNGSESQNTENVISPSEAENSTAAAAVASISTSSVIVDDPELDALLDGKICILLGLQIDYN